MNNLIFSLNTTMPIFLVMVIGYILKQIGMLNDNFVTVANKFNFKVTLPFMLFRDISTVNIREIFDLKYVLFCALYCPLSQLGECADLRLGRQCRQPFCREHRLRRFQRANRFAGQRVRSAHARPDDGEYALHFFRL